MKFSAVRIICVLSVFASGAISATPSYIFPLWNDGTEQVTESLSFNDNGLSLEVTAWMSSYNSSGEMLLPWQQVIGDDLGVYQDEKGLGVISVDGDGNDLDGGSSSNSASDPDEGLLFEFSSIVNLYDVFIGDLGSSDDFNVSSVSKNNDGSLALGFTITDVFGPAFEEEWIFEFNREFYGDSFLIWVDGSSDDIEVLGVSAIPEPGALLLLGTGLILLSFRRRSV